jgi:hypothetical protein
MAPSTCRPRWPVELGASERCLADATDAAQPITWNRNWMNPLATVCRIHGTWLTPVTTRTLAGVRHAGDFDGVARHLKAAQTLLDREPACAGDALWLQNLCTARTDMHLPWGRSRPQELTRVVIAVAREVISASNLHDSALGVPESGKDFAFETAGALRMGMSLPTRLRHRQGVLGRVAHVLRLAPEAQTFHPSRPAASTRRWASTCDSPEGALAWICPTAAELALQQGELRKEFSISPRYFKGYSAVLASIQ